MRENPERLAWNVLLAAFLVFLLLCGGAAYLIQWYAFESTLALQADITVGRGTVRITSPNSEEPIAVTDQRSELDEGLEIRTDTSQAVLSFSDPRTATPLASVVLLHDSQIELVRAAAPRFGVNRNPYHVDLRSFAGRSEILILDTRQHEINFVVRSPHAITTLTEPGQYAIEVTNDVTRVSVDEGQALVTDPTGGRSRILEASNRVAVGREEAAFTTLPPTETVIRNGNFRLPYTTGWELYDDSEYPPGVAYDTEFAGRSVLALDRSQEEWGDLRLGHGETGLIQAVNVDTSDLDSLELRATFYIEEQSLSTCGQQGSECPLMLRISYIDEQGVEREYIQGFYAYHDPAADYPLSCATCRGEHERVNLQAWYSFRSGNLLTNLPDEQKPVLIQQLRFYASGHAYKVYVSEVELVATNDSAAVDS
jgi:hypothetical protein